MSPAAQPAIIKNGRLPIIPMGIIQLDKSDKIKLTLLMAARRHRIL
jgi:hypothetical protein